MTTLSIHRLTQAAALTAVAVLTAGLAFGCSMIPGTASTPTAAEPTATAELTPTPEASLLESPTTGPTGTPEPARVEATTNGVLLPASDAALATRKPIAVMLDDHWTARPQSGLSQADVVYQALAEGGIPRYMALFQTQEPPLIGPIRSARTYFVAWAEEWRAMYTHVGGARDALERLPLDNKHYVWNADGIHWLTVTPYMWRVSWRKGPHNAYSDGAHLRALVSKLGGGADPSPKTPWAFGDPAPELLRPVGGTIGIPYYYNQIDYKYDRATNTYLRWETKDVVHHTMVPQVDLNNDRQIAPSVVVVMYVPTYMASGEQERKEGRLDLAYVGKGKALVFENGTVISARWAKSSEYSQTTLSYASGPDAGKRVVFVRGQIFVQVVAPEVQITYTLGTTVAPEY